jgi:hypothetical protein
LYEATFDKHQESLVLPDGEACSGLPAQRQGLQVTIQKYSPYKWQLQEANPQPTTEFGGCRTQFILPTQPIKTYNVDM